MPQLVIFTDLDGTLLDARNYSWRAAQPALDQLRRRRVPVVFCTSKTRAEILPLREELRNADPFVAENGGAIYVPRSYFPFPLPAVKLIAHYEGCFKKPGVTTRSSSLGTLVPGANQEKNFPLFLTEEEAFEERSFYRIHSIQLWSEGGEALFDLDWPLSSDKSLSISCPDLGKK